MRRTVTLPDAYLPQPVHKPGPFIAVEGVSGSGKSTVVAELAKTLQAFDLHVLPPAFQRRTPAVNAALRPLPQLAFYLSGLLHASDLVREYLPERCVVTDRYVSSVIANHTAVHGLEIDDVLAIADDYLPYLVRPALTVYLTVSKRRLAERVACKTDVTESDRVLFDSPTLMERVLYYYELLAERDERAVVIDTDDPSAAEVAERVVELAGVLCDL